MVSETCYDIWFGDSDADKKTAGSTGGGRGEDAKIFTRSDQHDRIRSASEGHLRSRSLKTKLERQG